MSLPVFKTRVIASLAICTGLLLGACSGSEAPSKGFAAKVDGRSISESDLQSELDDMAANGAYMSQLAAQGAPVDPEGDGTYSAELTAFALNNLVAFDLLEGKLKESGTDLNDLDLESGRENAEGRVGGSDVFSQFPEEYQNTLLMREAIVNASLKSATPLSTDDAELQKYYDENKDQFQSVCAKHILVADEETAQSVYDRVKAGEDFATLAAEVSTDSSAAQNGGDLGCLAPSGYVKEFADALVEGQPNSLVGPIKTQYGYHVIQIGEKKDQTFEEAKSSITQAIQQQISESFNTWLEETFNSAKVEVNKKYGTWETQGSDNIPAVVAPGSNSE